MYIIGIYIYLNILAFSTTQRLTEPIRCVVIYYARHRYYNIKHNNCGLNSKSLCTTEKYYIF